MWGLLSDLWLAVDALVEPGGTWMGDFPGKVTDDPAGRDTQDEQGMLRQVRYGFTMLLRATEEELRRSEGLVARKDGEGLPWPERELRLENQADLRRMRGLLLEEISKF
jgi:hypothetical protein